MNNYHALNWLHMSNLNLPSKKKYYLSEKYFKK
jgi:hypothetical protein